MDREGSDLASIRTAMNILRECRHPLVIFPEGEIYHHHEELDWLNEGVATILLRAAEKLPAGKRSFLIPASIHVTHDQSISATFSPRMDALERRITWKPKTKMQIVDRIYLLGSALLSIKEEEFIGRAQPGELPGRIRNLQLFLIEQAERKHGLAPEDQTMPARIKMVRQVIRRKLTADTSSLSREEESELYDDLERVFIAQQLYSYPGRYLRQQPTLDRIAETILKLEEDVLELERYPAPRQATITFGEPIDAGRFLTDHGLNSKSGVGPMTQLLHQRLRELLGKFAGPQGD